MQGACMRYVDRFVSLTNCHVLPDFLYFTAINRISGEVNPLSDLCLFPSTYHTSVNSLGNATIGLEIATFQLLKAAPPIILPNFPNLLS